MQFYSTYYAIHEEWRAEASPRVIFKIFYTSLGVTQILTSASGVNKEVGFYSIVTEFQWSKSAQVPKTCKVHKY